MMLRYDTDERIVFPYDTGENSGICMLVNARNNQMYICRADCLPQYYTPIQKHSALQPTNEP
jgi:hypothetical protein